MAIDRAEPMTYADLRGDLAGRYHPTPSSGARIDDDVVQADLAKIERDGYIVWEGLLSDDERGAIRDSINPLLDHTGRNSFEGNRTQRAYSVLNKTRACDQLVEHPRVLAVLDRLLMPNYLLSILQAINIQPGESAQLLHVDDGFYPIPRPHPPLGAATIWAIDDFTDDNGATVVVPGSHHWGRRQPTDTDPRRPVVMPAGSCVFFVSTLWHGGGANTSAGARLAMTAQYCQPWLRPLEAFTLSVPLATVRAVSDDIQRMLGYSVHPPFVGSVDGKHPLRLLDQDVSPGD